MTTMGAQAVARLAVKAVADGWRPDHGPAAARRLLRRVRRMRLLDPDCDDGVGLAAVIERLHDLAAQLCVVAAEGARLRLRTTAMARDSADAWATWRRLDAHPGETDVRVGDALVGARGLAARWPRADLIVSARDAPAISLSAQRGRVYADAVWRQDEGRFRSARADLLLLDRALRAVAHHGGVAVMAFDPRGQEDAWEEIRLQLAAERRALHMLTATLHDDRLCIVARAVAPARASSMAGAEPKGAEPWSKPMSSFWAGATTAWSAPSIWRARG